MDVMEVMNDNTCVCDVCARAKSTRQDSSKGARARLHTGEVSTDLYGPFADATIEGSHHLQVFRQLDTKWLEIFGCKKKNESVINLKNYISMFPETKHYHADGAAELISEAIMKVLNEHEPKISMTYSAPYSPNQNAHAEASWRVLAPMALANMLDSKLPFPFCEKSFKYAAWILNRLPTKTDRGYMSPYEYLKGTKPDLSMARRWGCKAWVNIPLALRRKDMQQVSWLGYFVELSEEQPYAWGIWNPKLNKVEFSSDVVFDENFHETIKPSTKKQELEFYMRNEEEMKDEDINNFEYLVKLRYFDEDDRSFYETTRVAKRGQYIVAYRREIKNRQMVGSENDFHPIFVRDVEKMIEKTDNTEVIKYNEMIRTGREGVPATTSDTGRGGVPKRAKRAREAALVIEDHPQGGNKYDKDEDDPEEIAEAIRSNNNKHWEVAMRDELFCINTEKEVWYLDTPPPGVKPMKTRFVFKSKFYDDDRLPKFRARLVGKGYTQIEGVDYHETFSPTARANTFRLFMYFVLLFDMTTPSHLDAVKAFLNSDVDCDIWVTPPYDPDHIFFEGWEVYKLKKSLYGLKQAGRLWYILIDKLLKSLGFKSVATEPCFYFSTNNGKLTMIVLYVDDCMVSSQCPELHKYFKTTIMKAYEFTDEGEVEEYLGVRVCFLKNEYFRNITLDQTKYINKKVMKFKIMNERPARTPMIDKLVLSLEDELDDGTFPYRSWIGSALHVSRWTRADVSFAVGALARFSQNVTKKAVGAVVRLWVYMRDTSNFRLVIKLSDIRMDNYRMFGYGDADWGADLDTRRSTSGWMLFIGETLINWGSELEKIIAQSTSEAEIRSLGKIVNEVVYMQNFFIALGILPESHKKTRVFSDNSGALQILENPVFHKRTKHIEISTLNVRDKAAEERIIPTYVPTRQNPSDICTKNVDFSTLSQHRNNIGLLEFRK